MPEFVKELDVRWGDMDAFGHVSNVVYLRYIEETRGHWLSSLLSRWDNADTGPVVANININFRRPVIWPQRLRITLKPHGPGRSSLKTDMRIEAGGEDDGEETDRTLFADATATLVWVDRESGEPVPLPGVLRTAGET